MYSQDAHLARMGRMVACASVSAVLAASVFTALPSVARAEEAVEPEAVTEGVVADVDEAEAIEEEAVEVAEPEVAAEPEAAPVAEEVVLSVAAEEEPVLVAAAPSNVGWVEVSGNWIYYNANGVQVYGFQQINNKWYYLDPDNYGFMVAGKVFEAGGIRFVADSDGVCPINKWVKIGSDWYFTGSNHGNVCTGWIKVDGKNYYMANDGIMKTGQFSVSGKNYIADEYGVCKPNAWVKYAGFWYLTDANCACRTGWAQDNGKWYYLREGGDMATGWVNDGKSIYYMSEYGPMCTGWKQIEGEWYYFKDFGGMATGWQQVDGLWYYLNPNEGLVGSGKMVSGQIFSDGSHQYVAKASGECPMNGWVQVDGSWYRTDGSCVIRTGWYQVDGVWYFSNPMDGKMFESVLFSYQGKTYIATASGACPANTWVKLSGYWYYTDDSCALRSGWVQYKNDWYYMDKSSFYMLTDTTTPDGYKVDKDGKWVK